MKMVLREVYHGPNPYALAKVLVVDLELDEALRNRATALCEKLHRLRPEWHAPEDNDPASPDRTIALAACRWALGILNADQDLLSVAGAEHTPAGARLWLEFHVPNLAVDALKLTLDIFAAVDRSDEVSATRLDRALAPFRQRCGQQHPDTQAHILMQAARALDLPYLPVAAGSRFWQFGWGRLSRKHYLSGSNRDGAVALRICRDKNLSKQVFSALGAPTPDSALVRHPREFDEAVNRIGFPCVTKPLDGDQGRGVTVGIRSTEALEHGYQTARQISAGPVMVETFVPGADHRLMITDGRFLAAIKRTPPEVTGDGRSTVQKLVNALNSWRQTAAGKEKYLHTVAMDDRLNRHLTQQGLTLDAIIESGRTVTLRDNANHATGGDWENVTSNTHPQVARMAEMLAQSIGLSTAGLDFITTDISRPWQETGGAFIEINVNPGMLPYMGKHVLGHGLGRIPVHLALVDEAALPSMTAWLTALDLPYGAAWTSGDSAAVNAVPLSIQGNRPWSRVETLLRHQSASSIVVVATATELVRKGAPVDRLETSWVCGVPLDENWRQVLERVSRDTHFTHDLASMQQHLTAKLLHPNPMHAPQS